MAQTRSARRLVAVLASGALLLTPMATSVPAHADPDLNLTIHKAQKTYIVQLADAPVASYTGGVKGYPATKPAKGNKLQAKAPAATKWAQRLRGEHDATLRAIGLNTSRKGRDYHITFNGFTAQLTDLEAAQLTRVPGVVNVWEDEVRYADTVSTPDYLGLTGSAGVWAQQFGGTANAGKGVVIGIIDTGIDSHNPAFAPLPADRTVPSTFKGVCDKGADPTFVCNNKIIGARYYAGGNTGNTVSSLEIAAPTDRNGHGSHTASTAAGNNGVKVSMHGYDMGTMSGMAPAAQIAVYKALWTTEEGKGTGATNGLVAAIEDATADGVDVINYSISGSRDYVVTPDEIAFRGAADAGVFIATSAGNSGEDGPSTVAHNSPWTMTVAASTHDRAPMMKKITLGNGQVYEGYGMGEGVGPAPLILAKDAGLPGADATKLSQCYSDLDDNPANGVTPLLDPEKVKGKIVVCDRGGNARVDKSHAVKLAGGVGLVHVNLNATQTLNADFHDVPTIHLDSTKGAAVKQYAATPGATGTLSASYPGPKPVSPEMGSFSSYGPALAGRGDLLKPDITAPGVDIIAAVQAAPDGSPQFDSLQGTSMSSPHIAGLGALLKQKFPTWSPAMIKSAMMTTATPLNSAGKPITRVGEVATPLNYGSGMVQPAKSYNPGLVYDSGLKDWIAYACAIKQLELVEGPDACKDVPTIDPSDLNYPSIAVGDLVGVQTITRTVKSVATTTVTYTASVEAPAGTTVTVSPSSFTIAPGQSKTFKVTITRTNAPLKDYTFGSLTWKGSSGESVRSPIAIRTEAISVPTSLQGTGVIGNFRIPIKTGFSGQLTVDVDGLIPSQTKSVDVVRNPKSSVDGLTVITVPEGTKALKVATYGSEVPAKDIDMVLLDSKYDVIATSAQDGSSESFIVPNPKPGVYIVVIDLYSPEAKATVPVQYWTLTDANEGNMIASVSPAYARIGGTATVLANYGPLKRGKHYFGALNVSGAGQSGTTYVEVES